MVAGSSPAGRTIEVLLNNLRVSEDKMIYTIRYRIARIKSNSICKSCMKFCREYENEHSDVKAISRDWHNIFNKVCGYLGIGKGSTKVLWTNMCCGNWDHLHQTDSEKNNTSDDWFKKFCWDLFYCSDRWTVDRLMRVHWYYLQWTKSLNS